MSLDRHPLVVYLLGWAAFIGFGGAIDLMFGEPRSPGGQLPVWLDLCWYLLLAFGGSLVLLGTFWRDPLIGVLIARAGYWPTGTGGVIYAGCLATSGMGRSAFVLAAFSVACIWRAASIRRDVRAVLAGEA